MTATSPALTTTLRTNMDAAVAIPKTGSFTHGCSDCRVCFKDAGLPWHSPLEDQFAVGGHRWSLRANLGYWGSAAPEILVLGFSKGPEQAKLIGEHVAGSYPKVRFEDIAFNDGRNLMRGNLKKLLTSIGLLDPKASIDKLFEPTEKLFGFASLVRCSVAYAKPNSDAFVGTGGGITSTTLKKRPDFVRNCVKQHLGEIPRRVKLIVMLGVTMGYVVESKELLGGDPFFPGAACSYAYMSGQTPVIHVPHPSGGNNGAIAVFTKERAPTTLSNSEDNIPECRRQVDFILSKMNRREAAEAVL